MRQFLFLAAALSAMPLLGEVVAQDDPLTTLPAPRASLSDDERARAVLVGAPEVDTFLALPFSLPQNVAQGGIELFAAGEFEKMGLEERTSDSDKRIVITDVRALLDKSQRSRLALVTLYQYENNRTIQRVVDLDSDSVLRERTSETLTPALAPVELTTVKQLVARDREIQSMLGTIGAEDAEVEGLVISVSDPDDPLYRHRVVEVQFKTARGYASIGKRVIVDLSENKVIKQD